MCRFLEKKGYAIELLEEMETNEKSCDITLNGIKAELKSVYSFTDLGKRVNDAIAKKAEVAIFEFYGENIDELIRRIKGYRGKNVKIMYYVKGSEDLVML